MPDDPYSHLPPERAEAVRKWLSTPVGTCRLCGQPVYPTDSRQRDPKEPDENVHAIVHLPCLQTEQAENEERATDPPVRRRPSRSARRGQSVRKR